MNKASSSRGLLIGMSASLGLLVLSYLRIAGDVGSAYFAGGGIVESAFGETFWVSLLAGRLLRFALTLLSLHVLLGAAAWLLGHASVRAWRGEPRSARVWTLLWVLALIAWILFANAAFFPSSSLGQAHSQLASVLGGATSARISGVVLGAAIALTLVKAAVAERTVLTWIGGAAALAVVGGSIAAANHRDPVARLDADRPHVILIGLDSLRPDVVRSDEGHRRLPRLNEFLDAATEFTDTLTPLARTFPSWVSVVSGKHPQTTGAIANLLPRELIHEGDTLPKLLRSSGYATFYATDEVRFSNLDETYGFDTLVAPPMGAADFLLSFFGDSPLANLLANQSLGHLLFPYAYANRGAAITYEPDVFVERLDSAVNFDVPTFLAVHLTLVHWPYTWAEAAHLDDDPAAQYMMAATRLDRQFGDILESLEKKGALANAIVVVFSDHGESLGEAPTTSSENGFEPVRAAEISFGHGTNVVADYQHHVLLGIRSFGKTGLDTPAIAIDAPTSVEDIAPTIMQALGLEARDPVDGISLVPLIAGKLDPATLGNRLRFVETGFNPRDFDPQHVTAARALRSAGSFYRVDPETDRVELRAELLEEILASRQYAAIKAGNKLAAFPPAAEAGYHLLQVEPTGKTYWLAEAPNGPAANGAEDLWHALVGRFPHLSTARVVSVPRSGTEARGTASGH